MNEDKKYRYVGRFCGFCNKYITYKNWSRHLRTPKHLRNDRGRTITPKPKKPPKIFTDPRKAHKVLNFSKILFDDEQNIRTVVKTKETAFEYRLLTYEVENSKKL